MYGAARKTSAPVKKPPKAAPLIGPLDHGRRMSWRDFEFAKVQEGHLYELGRGRIVVSEVPKPRHFQVNGIRRQFSKYDLDYPGRIFGIATGSECKLLIPDLDSERHPDLAIYKTRPPRDDNKVWREWLPELVIEVISLGSETRDYFEKLEEYLKFGVKEYWIVDFPRRQMLALRRVRDKWVERTVRAPDLYRTRLFPGLEFDIAAVFSEAEREEE
jgi:Uma2 family endonuclease